VSYSVPFQNQAISPVSNIVFNLLFDNRENPYILDRLIITIEKTVVFKNKEKKRKDSGHVLIT